MSEPFIKVWASDMRADQKIALLLKRQPLGPYLLVQAWDMAKNSPVYGELRNADGTPMLPVDFADLIPGVTTKAAVQFYGLVTQGNGHALAQEADDGALLFSKLERRQGNRRLSGDVPSELSEKRAAAGAKGASARWDGKPHGKPHGKTHGKGDGKTHGNLPETGARPRSRDSREPEPEPDLSRNRSSKPSAQEPATHGDDQPVDLPNQLRKILPDQVIHDLKPSQVPIIVSAWEHATEQLRESIADIEKADKPVAMLVHKAKQLAPSQDATGPTPKQKRGAAIRRIRLLAAQDQAAGEPPDRTRTWLEQEYHQTPGIVTEALGPPAAEEHYSDPTPPAEQDGA